MGPAPIVRSKVQVAANDRWTSAAAIVVASLIVAGIQYGWRYMHVNSGASDRQDTIFIDLSQSKQRNVIWVDVRPMDAFLKGHVPGALHIDGDQIYDGMEELLRRSGSASIIVVYCTSANCPLSASVARNLRIAMNTRNVYVLAGGWNAWLIGH